ncbi:hypothetical protein [Segatella salivae]|uniref:Uncharacterized protein n=1 Tax=Segatella salivae F0493 TaxID=1395125 RepID=U2L5X6_9BACT|nr:hypothetical protein [Segatella salivae]ERJ99760.1 hypothetical protein HMPREF9145_1063 [Segatella salivae F0493]
MALHYCNIRNGGYIHWSIGTKALALRSYNIRNGGYIHWSIGTMALALRITTVITANGLIRDIDMVDNQR